VHPQGLLLLLCGVRWGSTQRTGTSGQELVNMPIAQRYSMGCRPLQIRKDNRSAGQQQRDPHCQP
jgi:hypothetical protein